MSGRTLTFDVETHSAELLYSMEPHEFVRLCGYSWDDGPVVLTTDLEELKEQIRSARFITGHNIHSFDLKAVFGYKSNEPLELAMQRRVYDTWTHAALVNPAPAQFINRFGKNTLAAKPEQMTRWFGLDEQAHQLGVPGKTHDLKALAKEFAPEGPVNEVVVPDGKGGFKVREVFTSSAVNAGFGRIPVDDERYRDYLIGDVEASRAVAKALLKLGPLDDYAMREQEIEARKAVIESNGFRVDIEAATRRRDELKARRDEIMAGLVEKYDFPTEGKSPWASAAGKAAIMAALADQGITPASRSDWPRTATGTPSLGGEALIDLTKGTPAEDLGKALAELKGQRSLSQLALDSVHPDGFVHPSITMLQRSARWSTTEPGLTIWTSRGEGAVEKSYFVPDTSDEVLVEFDYSNADARIVAAYSGDKRFAERFEPGADGHLINAWAAWGKDTVGTDKHDPTTAEYRFKAKALGHGWNYGGQAKGLARVSGLPLDVSKVFCDGMAKTFHRLVQWQNAVRREASRGYVTNEWGRKLWVEKGREFTQAPALKGQNGTREIICDALLAMPVHVLRRVKAQIHDALILSVPAENWEACRDYVIELMSTSFEPARGGQRIEFPVSSGPAGKNWMEASHD